MSPSTFSHQNFHFYFYKQGDHPCIVCDGPTKRPQYMRISRLITVTYLFLYGMRLSPEPHNFSWKFTQQLVHDDLFGSTRQGQSFRTRQGPFYEEPWRFVPFDLYYYYTFFTTMMTPTRHDVCLKRFNRGLWDAEPLLLLHQLTQEKCHQCVKTPRDTGNFHRFLPIEKMFVCICTFSPPNFHRHLPVEKMSIRLHTFSQQGVPGASMSHW